MEVDEMPTPGCKFPRIRSGNGRADSSSKVGKKRGDEKYLPEEEGEADGKAEAAAAAAQGRNLTITGVAGEGLGVGGGGLDVTTAAGGLGRFCGGWPSSRIVRVSRASGGKDRHSKVWTSKGLRDRRVRLSVNTAIQFYDLQDRLGYDQPSKAVEWLLKAASSSISELPSINTSFPDTPQQQQLSDEKRSSTTVGTTDQHGFDSAEADMESDQQQYLQHHAAVGGGSNFSKSACSSTSENSKGSGLSLSRSESRIKARERARERAAEKEKEKDHQNPVNPPPISQSSFTELLTGVGSNNNTSSSSPNRGNNGGLNESNFFHKSSPRHWSSTTPMDYFATGLLGGPSSSRAANPSSTTSSLGKIHLGNHQLHHQSLTAVSSPLLFSVTGGGEHHHSELHHFSFVPDHHLVPVVTTANNTTSNGNGNGNHGGSPYNLNFTMTPSSASFGTFASAGFDRGTLQSNSSSRSSLLQSAPQLIHRFQNMDRSSAFFTPTSTAPQPNATAVEDHHHHNHHQHSFLPGFDAGGLQLCYGDGHGGGHHPNQKEKVKH